MTVRDRFGVPDTLSEPFDFLRELRDEEPVFFSETLDAYVVTRHETVRHVLQTPEIFSSYPANASAATSAAFAPQYTSIYHEMGTYPPLPTLVITDGDIHRRYRHVASKAFPPQAMRGLEAAITTLVDELIDEFIEGGRTDLYTELCLKLPSFTMCDVLGLPREGAPIMKRGADTSPRLQSGALETEASRLDLHRQRAEMHCYIQQHIALYRDQPADNVISRIITAQTRDDIPLTEHEIVSLIATLNVGGNETTVNGLGNMMYVALTTPGLLDRLHRQPDDIALLIEESLRVESAVMALPRRVVDDTELHGVAIPKDARVFVFFGAANRDERAFACPHAVNLDRAELREHVGFGYGPHFCMGAPLARLQMTIAMQRVLSRLPNVSLDPAQPIRHQSKMVVRGVEALPVTFMPGARSTARTNPGS